jgi:hypothetical protein
MPPCLFYIFHANLGVFLSSMPLDPLSVPNTLCNRNNQGLNGRLQNVLVIDIESVKTPKLVL